MLTKEQIQNLSQELKIDTFTVFREYLQIVWLNSFYKTKGSEKVYFKGGTALRVMFNSPRFSEDLDFSTTLSAKDIAQLATKATKTTQGEIPNLNLKLVWRGKKSIRYRLSYQDENLKFPLNIRLDFSFEKNLLPPESLCCVWSLPPLLLSVPRNGFRLCSVVEGWGDQ